jgi:hypothetical protein
MSNQVIERKPNGQFAKGVSGNLGGNAHRSRHSLNADTIREMHRAFAAGGRKAIDKVMKQQPAVFLKLLVLLVPREMKVEHTGGVKAMSDEQLEQGIEAIQAMLEQRAGSAAKVIEGTAETVALPAPDVVPDGPNKFMGAADAAVGPRERKPRKGRVPSPPGE